MSNLYEDTAPAAEPATPLSGDVRCAVVVVGGGFTGLSTALHLAERGVEVVLLEAQSPGWGASGRNGGQVNPGLKHDPDAVEAAFGAELGGRMNALAGAAPARVFDLIERHGIRCEARRNGTLRAALGRGHAARVRSTAAQWQRRGAPVEFLEGDALAHLVGTPRYRAALYDRRGGDLNPLSYARGLAAAATRAGAVLHAGTRAVGIERSGGEWRVATPSGTVCGPQVVLATNGYTDDLWPKLRRTVVPVFGAIAATAPLPEAAARVVLPGRPVVYESGAITVYYRVDAKQRLVMGGRGPLREIASAAELPHLVAYAQRLWPVLAGLPWTHGWGGRLAMTPDQYPHVHEPAPGVLVGLGYNGRGVAMATAMGAQLAARILRPTEDIDLPITDMKTIPLHALWPVAVRAAIARGRIADLLGL